MAGILTAAGVLKVLLFGWRLVVAQPFATVGILAGYFVVMFSLFLSPYLVGGHIDDDWNLVGLRKYAWGFVVLFAVVTLIVVRFG